LYEALTGQRLFESVVEIMGAVLNQEPDISAAPARVHKLLRWCLEKGRKQGLRAIGDARRLLDDSPAPTAEPPPRQGWMAWGVAGLLLAALAALSFVHFQQKPALEQTLRSSITLPENSTVHSFAISPDGHALALAVTVNGKRQLWLRAMDALQSQAMPFTEEATYPFWSPDSRSIGFFAQGKLKKIAASGGPAQALCDVLDGRGGSWNRNDVMVFSPQLTGAQIQRLPAAGFPST
jgi:eukaryotic-like serine/threonine-protein kinase